MEKPRAAAIRLYELGYLHGITVEYRPTGDDTATSFVTIKGSNGTAQGLLKTYEEFLESKELAEFNRLKAKFSKGE
mgnify:CR=1 FL=1